MHARSQHGSRTIDTDTLLWQLPYTRRHNWKRLQQHTKQQKPKPKISLKSLSISDLRIFRYFEFLDIWMTNWRNEHRLVMVDDVSGDEDELYQLCKNEIHDVSKLKILKN